MRKHANKFKKQINMKKIYQQFEACGPQPIPLKIQAWSWIPPLHRERLKLEFRERERERETMVWFSSNFLFVCEKREEKAKLLTKRC